MKTRTTKQRDCYKALFYMVKYIPIVSAIFLWVHIVLFVVGIDETIFDHLFDSSIPRAALMLIASYAFGFCCIHRGYVFYNFVTTLAICYNNEYGFSSVALIASEFVLITSGIALLAWLFIKRIHFILDIDSLC